MRISTTVPSALAAAAIVALAPAVGLAAEAGDAPALPQLNPANFAPQLVWLAISFAILYVLMSKFALPRVADVLEERQRRIDENLKKAEALKADAERASETYQRTLAEARAKAQDEVRMVREQAKEEAARREAELGEKLGKQIKEAEQHIQEAKDTALKDLRGLAIEVAGAASEKLLGEPVDEATVAAAVDKAMEERA